MLDILYCFVVPFKAVTRLTSILDKALYVLVVVVVVGGFVDVTALPDLGF